MANMMKCGIKLFTVKHAKRVVPRVFLPARYQRQCFHTSWILDVKGKELLMPSLSPTMENGTIVKWLKKEGDPIAPGDAIADIQTDKAVMTLEFDDESVLAKIIVAEGKSVKVGELIALTVETDEDWKSVEMPSEASAAAAGAPAASSPPSAAATAGPPEAPPPGQTNVSMPSLSPTMTTGTIVKWLKKEGDSIEAGDAIADIQTDKAVMTFEMEEEAVFAKILAPEGSQAEVGDLIAIIVEKDFDLSKIVVPSSLKQGSGAPTTTDAESPAAAVAAAPAASATKKDQPPPSGQVYGLAVKRLLEEYGLSSGSVQGTGRPNRLLKEDVLAYIKSNNVQKVGPKSLSAPSEAAPTSAAKGSTAGPKPRWSGGPSTFTDGPVSNIRAVIAKRLGESKSGIPHSYASIDINIDKLNEVRSKLRMENVKVSVNDFITKAAAHALLECPDVNTLYQNGQVIPQQKVDISVAVSTPTGLITPIVFNAAFKGLADISNDVKALAGKAREGKLQPQEFQGGTFTISNLGMFGIRDFCAIINPPQTAILAVGTGREILDVSLKKSTVMTVTLSYDRRAIDEDQAADFLAVLQAMLQDPTFLTIGRSQTLRHRRE
ncbi:dihydrolipoyllysine-residue acetyltransferase component of pyruvate dehydrogenase complex, mitochondrial-like [Phymastichus coffea]|uniref:dihydrolipoyllysine-residue acetyltransferase component of pyruvate dehydrogenase complex, mitochondrial-like n=1 Tax=Phymastichus coffea TaxID=108790 RepID=UPI00273B14E2|nr:dihydrolipoyllysine-residue acetyltransferase component of pyruvate dehydrogenase complex, mitochondrial-like [Phymastichus coffea]